jgi:hypothetical protein
MKKSSRRSSPPPNDGLVCAECGETDRQTEQLVPFGIGEVYWLHSTCWERWFKQDQEYMMQKKFPPSGRLFKNDYKNSQNAPDVKGDLEISEELLVYLNDLAANGEVLKMELAGWKTSLDRGGFFYRMKAQAPFRKDESPRSSTPRREERAPVISTKMLRTARRLVRGEMILWTEEMMVKSHSKPFRLRSKKYLVHVRGFPCLVCSSPYVDAHHLQRAQPRALSRKTGDQWAIPLCRSCHMNLHAAGDEATWWDLNGVDPYEWAREQYDVFSSVCSTDAIDTGTDDRAGHVAGGE